VRSLDTRERTQPPARGKLNGWIAQVMGSSRGVGAGVGRSLAGRLGRLGRADGVVLVVRFLFADGSSPIIGRVWALGGRGEV
jgi:hypothetical protein